MFYEEVFKKAKNGILYSESYKQLMPIALYVHIFF